MDKRPNILVILADQLRGQALGCAGDPNVDTPHIDQLAAEGVRCTNSCSTYPVCVPYRFSFLTGEHAHTRYVPSITWRMSPAERTIAHAMNDAGYETSYVGKWHLHGLRTAGGTKNDRTKLRIPPGYRGGFKHWNGFENSGQYFNTHIFNEDNEDPDFLEGYQTDALSSLALKKIESLSKEPNPFFMVLSVEPPHDPYRAPEDLMEKYRAKELIPRKNVRFDREPEWADLEDKNCVFKDANGDLLDETAARAKAQECLAGYYAQIENLDQNVGRIREGLKALNVEDDTIILFISDHGCQHQSHGFYNKQMPFEESVNVPLIAFHPASGMQGGGLIDEPTCTEDFYPTLLGLAGITPDEKKPGMDLSPLLRQQKSALDRDGVYLEWVCELRPKMPFFHEQWRALRTREYKYIERNNEPCSLFHLTDDPYEMNNLLHSPEAEATAQDFKLKLQLRATEFSDDRW